MKFGETVIVGIDFFRKLVRNKHMLRVMSLRKLKQTYVGSFLGILWPVLTPLAQLLIYGVVFGVFFGSKVDPKYGTDSFMLYLMCGLIPWQLFSQTLNTTMRSVASNFTLVKKAVGFPSEILPIVTIISALISHCISLVLLIVAVIIVQGRIPLEMPLVFLYLLFFSSLAIGLGWILSSVYLFFRDIEQVISLVLMGLFFFTPILYSPSVVPARFLPILKLNPIYHMVEGYRLTFLTGQPLPLNDALYFALFSVVVLVIGGIIFRKLKPWFVEVL